MRDLEEAFDDVRRRPSAASGPIQATYETLVRDWTHDSGAPGDKYDPELAASTGRPPWEWRWTNR